MRVIHKLFRKWLGAPLWVNVVYAILDWMDTRLLYIQDILGYRYRLLDKHCQGEYCIKRRNA